MPMTPTRRPFSRLLTLAMPLTAALILPHRVLGEEVGAVVQVTPGSSVGEEELRQHVAGGNLQFIEQPDQQKSLLRDPGQRVDA